MKPKAIFHFVLLLMFLGGEVDELSASLFPESGSGSVYLHKTDSLGLMSPLSGLVLSSFLMSGTGYAGYGSGAYFHHWQPSPLNFKSLPNEPNESDKPGAEQKTVVEAHGSKEGASRESVFRSPGKGGGNSVSCGGSGGDDPDPNDNRANYDRSPPKEMYPDLPLEWLTFTFWGDFSLLVNDPRELLLLKSHSFGYEPGVLGHIVLHHQSGYCMPYIHGPTYNWKTNARPLNVNGSVAYQFVIPRYNLDVVLRKKNQHWVFAFTRNDASLNVRGNVVVSLTGEQGGLWQYSVPERRINQLPEDLAHTVSIDDQVLSWFSNEEAVAVSFGTRLIRPFDTGGVEEIIENDMVKHGLIDRPRNEESDQLEANDLIDDFKKMDLNRSQSNDSGYGEEADQGASQSE